MRGTRRLRNDFSSFHRRPGPTDAPFGQRNNAGARRRRAPAVERFGKPVPGSIPTIVQAYKSATTQRINALPGTPGAAVWQRNFYEHITRDGPAVERIRAYIQSLTLGNRSRKT